MWRRGIAGQTLSALAVGMTICLCSRHCARAEERPELRQKVERYVADLDAESRSVRSAARESLMALGPAILPMLPGDDRLTAAARDAIGRIRRELERQSALATLKVSRVTLRSRLPLREILKIVTAQTGDEFDLKEISESSQREPVDVDDASRPFWSACDDIVRRAHLAYAAASERGRLKLVPARSASPAGELAVANEGPVRVSVVRAAVRTSPGESSQKRLRIAWQLMVEPRLRPLFARIAARGLLVSGSNSDSVPFKPVSPAAQLELSLDETASPLVLDSDYEVPLGNEPSAVDFRGSLQIEMAAGPERLVFDDIRSVQSQSKRAGTAIVRLRRVDFSPHGKSGRTARIEVSLIYDQGGPAFESFRTWMYHNPVWLEAKNGRRLAPESALSTGQQGDGSIAIEYNFARIDGEPGDYRFVYVVPSLICELPVEFRFPKIAVLPAANKGARP